MERKIANPGSALGEAVGALMETALEHLLSQISDEHGYHYLTSGVRKTKAGTRAKKLLLSDNYGNQYDIDGVIANASMQPLIIIESKYIHYTKHNRDKGSWICTAHSAVRRRYHSIRSSIAILAGSWSGSSVAMLKSNDINIFHIPFAHIVDLLRAYGIDFDWGEKDRSQAHAAWHAYQQLSEEEHRQIGEDIIEIIKVPLIALIEKILDDTTPREIKKIILEVVSNLGEVKVFEFDSVEGAMEFLENTDLDKVFLTVDSVTLFDPPPFDE